MRILKLRKRKLKIRDTIRTKCQLVTIKHVLLSIFQEMGISRNRLNNVKIRFGQSHEFVKNCGAFYSATFNEIVLHKNITVASAIVEIAHEMGHKVTKFGAFSLNINEPSIIGETSAYNFQMRLLYTLHKVKGIKIKVKINFKESMQSSPVHCISFYLKFLPLGYLIKNEYKNK